MAGWQDYIDGLGNDFQHSTGNGPWDTFQNWGSLEPIVRMERIETKIDEHTETLANGGGGGGGGYVPPEGGIPYADLEPQVRLSLDAADAALQPGDAITSPSILRIVLSEDEDLPLENGDLLIVVPPGTLDPDITAPSTPTGLNATSAGPTSVNLNWSASTDDTGVTGYEYRIGAGSAVDMGAGLSETVGGLTASTLYSFQVRAYDAAGNRSAWSTADAVTTDAPPAVTFQTDFAGMTAEVAPTGWTSRWAAPSILLVKDDALVGATKLLKIKTGGSTRTGVSWDGGGSNADVELLARWRPTGTDGGGRLLARGAGATSSETALAGYLSSGGAPTIWKYDSGVSASLAASSSIGMTPGNWYRTRMRVIGTTVQLRIWNESGSEPGTWNVTATSVPVTAAGWVGVMAFNNGETDFDWISVAYDGGTAPTV